MNKERPPLQQQHPLRADSATRSREWEEGEQGWNSARTRAESAQGPLAKPADEQSAVSSSQQAETGAAEQQQQQSTPQAAAAPPPVKPAKPAWSAPKSWGDLAGRSSNRTASIVTSGAGASTAASSSSAVTSPVLPSTSASASPSVRNSMILPPAVDSAPGKKPNGHSPAPAMRRPPLEEALRAPPSFNAPLTLPRGLVNTGNLCFANSILQVLVFCAPFYNLLATVGRELPHDFANRTPLLDATVQFLREFPLMQNGSSSSSGGSGSQSAVQQQQQQGAPWVAAPDQQAALEPFAPEYVYDAMRLKKRFDAMRRGHQEDAEEFLGFFLDTLHEELLDAMQRSRDKFQLQIQAAAAAPPPPPSSQAVASQRPPNGISGQKLAELSAETASTAGSGSIGEDGESEISEREVTRPVSPSEEGWLEVGHKGKTSFTRTTSTSDSPITHTFGGKLRSVLRTPGAKDSVTLEPYQPLQLDIRPRGVQTIEDALRNLTEPETIPGVYSPKRDAIVDATKQVFIESLPPVLVLHLKRFVYDEIGGVQKDSKEIGYDTVLEVNSEVISPTRRADAVTRYRLFGVVYHHGRYATGGHYTVDVLRQNGTDWIHIDDTLVSPIEESSVRRRPVAYDDATHHAFTPRGPGSASGHEGLAYLLFYRREPARPKQPEGIARQATAMAAAAVAPAGTEVNGHASPFLPQHLRTTSLSSSHKPNPSTAAPAAAAEAVLDSTASPRARAAIPPVSRPPGAAPPKTKHVPGARVKA